MSDNGTGMATPPNNEPSGALTSQEVGRKKPNQGKFKSGIEDKRSFTRIDRNKHGIRRETNIGVKRTGRSKKV